MILSVEALADLQDIEDFIAGESIEAAQRMVDVIFEQLRVLESFPEAGRARPDVHPDIRSWPTQGYVVLYRIRCGCHRGCRAKFEGVCAELEES